MKKDIFSDEFLKKYLNKSLKKYWKELDQEAKIMLFVTIILNLIAILFLVICFLCNHDLTVNFGNQLGISFFCCICIFNIFYHK
jgi:flagellar biosynthesis/type III secretory pathway M-ring protein FliF/YscJ